MNKSFFSIVFMSLIFLMLHGCSTTVPVVAKFPDIPQKLMVKCPPLDKIEEKETTLSDVTKTVTKNYNTYYECAVKDDAWIEWYQIQKKIFEGLK